MSPARELSAGRATAPGTSGLPATTSKYRVRDRRADRQRSPFEGWKYWHYEEVLNRAPLPENEIWQTEKWKDALEFKTNKVLRESQLFHRYICKA